MIKKYLDFRYSKSLLIIAFSILIITILLLTFNHVYANLPMEGLSWSSTLTDMTRSFPEADVYDTSNQLQGATSAILRTRYLPIVNRFAQYDNQIENNFLTNMQGPALRTVIEYENNNITYLFVFDENQQIFQAVCIMEIDFNGSENVYSQRRLDQVNIDYALQQFPGTFENRNVLLSDDYGNEYIIQWESNESIVYGEYDPLNLEFRFLFIIK